MCRSSSPLFGDPVFRRFSRNEFERRFVCRAHSARRRWARGFHKRRCGGFDWYETVELGETSRLSPPDVLVT